MINYQPEVPRNKYENYRAPRLTPRVKTPNRASKPSVNTSSTRWETSPSKPSLPYKEHQRMGLSLTSLGIIMSTVPLMLSGCLIEMDGQARYERTWYSRFKKLCALSGLGAVCGVGLSIINRTNLNLSNFEEVVLPVIGGAICGGGWGIMKRCYYPPKQPSSENSLPPPSPDTTLCHLE